MGQLQASLKVNVPVLPDEGIWFLDATAWYNYWKSIPADVTLDPVDNQAYTAVAYNAALEPTVLNIVGVDYVLITQAMFDSLKDQLTALDNSYKQLRIELQAAGLLTNAQA